MCRLGIGIALLAAPLASAPAAAAEPSHAQQIQAQPEPGGQAGQPVPRREAEPSVRELRTPEDRRAATRAIYNGAYQRNLFNEPAAAEREFAAAQKRMEEVNPGDVADTYQGAVLFQRGYLRREAGDLDGALKLFDELVRRYPKNPYADDALYYSGHIHQFDRKDYERAAAAYSRVAEMYADRETAGKAMFQNAQVAVMANDDANVNPRLTQAVELTANDRRNRGQGHMPNFYETQARQQQEFIAGNSAGLPSQRPVNKYLQADNLMRQGRLAEAEGRLQKIASEFPQARLAAAAAYGLAECRRRAGKLDEAMRLYAEFLEKHPDSELAPRARFMLAELKRLAGLDAEAREHYARVKRQLEEMSRKVEYYGKGGSRVVEVELSADLERLKQVIETRLREVAAEQQKQIGK